MNIMETKEITKCFKVVQSEDFYALKQIDITVKKGTLTILKGRSGSGKTTLLNILSALDTQTSGSVYFKGEDMGLLSESEKEKRRRCYMGYVFQSVALIPMLNAYENVEFALRLAGYEGNWYERTTECLKKVGLEDRMYHMPREMSGGEQQRVAIARAIAHKPDVIFADEPTAELDTMTALQVVKVFRELVEKEGVSIIMTTHDTNLMDIGDRWYEMQDGEMIRTGGREINDCM